MEGLLVYLPVPTWSNPGNPFVYIWPYRSWDQLTLSKWSEQRNSAQYAKLLKVVSSISRRSASVHSPTTLINIPRMPGIKLRVAICGGGISGLCLAVALSRCPNIKVDVYEAAERFKEIGAGVMIWEKTWKILVLLGLAEDFSKIAHAPPDGSTGVGFDFRRSDTIVEGSRFRLVEMPYGCIRFHRAHFLDALVEHLPSDVAHFGRRLSHYSHSSSSSPVILHFIDGSTDVCDVLVGCDGIKSVVRAQMYRDKATEMGEDGLLQYIEPAWSGTIAYRGLIPVSRLMNDKNGTRHRTIDTPMMYCGRNKHIVSYSISQGSIVNVVTFSSQPEVEGTHWEDPWVTDCSKEEVLGCYSGFEPEARTLLEAIQNPTRWAIHALRPLPFYVMGNICLVGDSAHAMTPHQGAGAGQAIEDAYILSSLLYHPLTTVDTLGDALLAYERVRLTRANAVLLGSRDACKMYEFNVSRWNCRGKDDITDCDYARVGREIEAQWGWVKEDPRVDEQIAVEDFLARVDAFQKQGNI